MRSNIPLKVAELRLRKFFLHVAELRLRTPKKLRVPTSNGKMCKESGEENRGYGKGGSEGKREVGEDEGGQGGASNRRVL